MYVYVYICLSEKCAFSAEHTQTQWKGMRDIPLTVSSLIATAVQYVLVCTM